MLRPDGTLKVTGEFAFSSDLWMADMLWGGDAAQPAPPGPRSGAVNIAGALKLPGVAAVLTHDDVPGPQDLRPRSRRPAGAGRR